ncbi:MAG: hypothetical protein ABR550_06960 [Wenzhouxiangellaceae bacterium]
MPKAPLSGLKPVEFELDRMAMPLDVRQSAFNSGHFCRVCANPEDS